MVTNTHLSSWWANLVEKKRAGWQDPKLKPVDTFSSTHTTAQNTFFSVVSRFTRARKILNTTLHVRARAYARLHVTAIAGTKISDKLSDYGLSRLRRSSSSFHSTQPSPSPISSSLSSFPTTCTRRSTDLRV